MTEQDVRDCVRAEIERIVQLEDTDVWWAALNRVVRSHNGTHVQPRSRANRVIISDKGYPLRRIFR